MANPMDGMSLMEKGLYNNAQLIGMPAGVEAYKAHLFRNKQLATGGLAHQGILTARLEGIGRGSIAAAKQAFVDPMARGALEAFGGGMLHGPQVNFHLMGFGFQRTGTMADLIKTGASPFTSTGHIFTAGGAKAAGIRSGAGLGSKMWSRGMPFAGGLFGLMFTGHAAYSGYQREGVWGAAKGTAGTVGSFALWHVGTRLLGPAAIPIVASAGAWAGAAKNIMTDLAHAPRRTSGYDIAGNLSAFQGGQAYTMRQRSMQAIQKHHLNARSACGNEATYMHIGSLRML